MVQRIEINAKNEISTWQVTVRRSFTQVGIKDFMQNERTKLIMLGVVTFFLFSVIWGVKDWTALWAAISLSQILDRNFWKSASSVRANSEVLAFNKFVRSSTSVLTSTNSCKKGINSQIHPFEGATSLQGMNARNKAWNDLQGSFLQNRATCKGFRGTRFDQGNVLNTKAP